MAKTSAYSVEVDQRNLARMRQILDELPSFVSDFAQSRINSTTSRTQLSYTYDIRRFLQWWRDSTPELCEGELSAITIEDMIAVKARDLEAYMSFLREDPNNPNDRAGVARKMAAVGALFGYLYRNDYIPADPCAKINRPKIRKDSRIEKLSDKEVRDILHVIEHGSPSFSAHQQKYVENTRTRDLTIAILLLETGIRVSECEGLNIDDIDMREQRLQVYRKGGKYQYLPFNDEVAHALGEYLKQREKISPSDKSHAKALFLSSQNTRMKKNAIENMISKYAAAAGISRPISPHNLRKTYGTALYDETRDIYLVANALGHENVSTTTKHYVTDKEDSLREVVSKVRFKSAEDE